MLQCQVLQLVQPEPGKQAGPSLSKAEAEASCHRQSDHGTEKDGKKPTSVTRSDTAASL